MYALATKQSPLAFVLWQYVTRLQISFLVRGGQIAAMFNTKDFYLQYQCRRDQVNLAATVMQHVTECNTLSTPGFPLVFIYMFISAVIPLDPIALSIFFFFFFSQVNTINDDMLKAANLPHPFLLLKSSQ